MTADILLGNAHCLANNQNFANYEECQCKESKRQYKFTGNVVPRKFTTTSKVSGQCNVHHKFEPDSYFNMVGGKN